jgi:hypothetical protein
MSDLGGASDIEDLVSPIRTGHPSLINTGGNPTASVSCFSTVTSTQAEVAKLTEKITRMEEKIDKLVNYVIQENSRKRDSEGNAKTQVTMGRVQESRQDIDISDSSSEMKVNTHLVSFTYGDYTSHLTLTDEVMSDQESQSKQLQPYMSVLTSVLSECAIKINGKVRIVPLVINTGQYDWRALEILDGAMFVEDPPIRPFLALIRDEDNYFVGYGKLNEYGQLDPVIYHHAAIEVPTTVHTLVFTLTQRFLCTNVKPHQITCDRKPFSDIDINFVYNGPPAVINPSYKFLAGFLAMFLEFMNKVKYSLAIDNPTDQFMGRYPHHESFMNTVLSIANAFFEKGSSQTVVISGVVKSAMKYSMVKAVTALKNTIYVEQDLPTSDELSEMFVTVFERLNDSRSIRGSKVSHMETAQFDDAESTGKVKCRIKFKPKRDAQSASVGVTGNVNKRFKVSGRSFFRKGKDGTK